MKYEIVLKYHRDDATGSYGLAPVGTINQHESFNAFWGADGIFHDVFEHYMEGILPYYSNNGFMTLWGEMAASGHGLAYSQIGINSFRYRSRPYRDFTIGTISYIQDDIYDWSLNKDQMPYSRYDASKETCLVPEQKLESWRGTYDLENTISEYKYEIRSYAKKEGASLKRFCWVPGIARNYIYGWKLAQKIIGRDRKHSYLVLDKFLEDWNNICKLDAEHLFIEGSELGLYGIKFRVENRGKLKVTASLLEDCTHEEYHLEHLNSC